MQRLIGTLLLVGLILVLLAPTAALAAEDPGAVLKALADAENKHDVNAALALYADNAVVTAPGDNFQPKTYQGKDQIKQWESSGMDPSERVELGAVQASGNAATAPFKLYDASFKQMGLDPAEGKVSIVVDKGKIVALSIAFSPAWMNKAKAAMGAATGQSGNLPATGADSQPWELALLAGLGLLALGLGLRVRSRRAV